MEELGYALRLARERRGLTQDPGDEPHRHQQQNALRL